MKTEKTALREQENQLLREEAEQILFIFLETRKA